MSAGGMRVEDNTNAHAPRYRQRATEPLTRRFFSLGELLGFTAAILVVFVLLFPRAMIDRQLTTRQAVDAASIAYLSQLVHRQPHAVHLRLQLAQQALRAGELTRAQQALAPLASDAHARDAGVAEMWIDLRRLQVATLAPADPARTVALQRYARALWHLGPLLDQRQQLDAARAALHAGLYADAASMAERLLRATPSAAVASGSRIMEHAGADGRDDRFDARIGQSLRRLVGLVWAGPAAYMRLPAGSGATVAAPMQDVHAEAFTLVLQSWLAANEPAAAAAAAQRWQASVPVHALDWPQLVRIADWAQRPDLAATFAQRWLRSSSPNRRWQAFNALVNAYLAGDQAAQALAVAQANLSYMKPDARLWRYMTHLALRANQPQQAADYAARMLWERRANAH